MSATTVRALADDLGLHGNTVREHLDALVSVGLAVREPGTTNTRGRPAWLYAAVADRVEHDVRLRDYAGLTAALAAHLERTSADVGQDARAIGQAWGRDLAATSDAAPPSDARRRVVDLLTGLGFAPDVDADGSSAALRRCPLLDVARIHPEVVCNVHLGIVEGALASYAGDVGPVTLLPFAEPGACRLHLSAAR